MSQGSSQAFVKALKGAADPPLPGGPHKIDLAWDQWHSNDLHLPNKDEIIFEWLLAVLLKEKKTVLDLKPVCSVRHWSLLDEIIKSLDVNRIKAKSSTVRPWIMPMLNRIPFVPIVSSFFSSHANASPSEDLVECFARCVCFLWPLAIPKTNIEVLMECFGGMLLFLSMFHSGRGDSFQTSISNVMTMMTSSFRIAFGNSANKKKIFNNFTRNQLQQWMTATSNLSLSDEQGTSLLYNEVFNAGIEVMFSLDALKSSPEATETFSSIRTILADSNTTNVSNVRILPPLLRSFEQSIRKHRFSIFSSSSKDTGHDVQSRVDMAVLNVFSSCLDTTREFGHSPEVWDVNVALLVALEKFGLAFTSMPEQLDTLKGIAEWATSFLQDDPDESRQGETNSFIEILSVIIRIDYDIISPLLPAILVWLSKARAATYTSSYPLLRLIIDYHTKTRTINSYVTLVLECLSGSLPVPGDNLPFHTYQSYSSSILVSSYHLEMLAEAVKGYLTPGQTPETVKSVVTVLELAQRRVEASGHNGDVPYDSPDDSQRKTKKRKLASEIDRSEKAKTEMGSATISLSLLARAAASVLPFLPLKNLPDSSVETVVSLLREFLINANQNAIRQGLAPPSEVSEVDRWSCQVVSASALRLFHSLSLPPLCIVMEVGKLNDAVAKSLRDQTVLPELQVECFRHVLEPSQATPHSKSTWDTLLAYLCLHLQSDTTWSGLSSELELSEEGRRRAALALWHMTLDKWLPIMDATATPEQLQQFANILVHNLDTPGFQTHAVSTRWIGQRATLSAPFWEMPNIRDALVNLISKTTAFSDKESIRAALSDALSVIKAQSGDIKSWSLTVEQIKMFDLLFGFLLRAPVEYLPKSVRSDFFRRAIAIDVTMWVNLNGRSYESDPRRSVRSWLHRMSVAFGFTEVLTEHRWFVQYLISPEFYPTKACQPFIQASLDVVDSIYKHAIRSAIQGDVAEFVAHVHCNTTSLQDCFALSEILVENFSLRSLLQLISRVISDCSSASNLANMALNALKDLNSQLISILQTKLLSLLTTTAPFHETLHKFDVVKVWRLNVVLARWLYPNDVAVVPDFGKRLLKILASHDMQEKQSPVEWTTYRNACSEVFFLLLEEVPFKTGASRNTQLEMIIAAYITINRSVCVHGSAVEMTQLSRAHEVFSDEDYATFFNMINQLLAGCSLPVQDLCGIIRFSNMLTKAAPDSASKLTHGHVIGCIRIFCDSFPLRKGCASLGSMLLNWLGSYYSDHPSSIKLLDVGPTWSLLANFLAGSREHDETTSPQIFHAIISISSSLVRLRRDVVLSTLPLLSVILRRLFATLRTVRPQLGAKQSKIVAESLPWWVNTATPLGVEEATALARLLTALSTKTVARRYGSAEEKQKSESLARPFSKHAQYVIVAYIEAMSDPLCTMPSLVRKALEPGMFALCGMMTEHGRDAIMVQNLDTGGKAMLKLIWKDYDKQRYIGHG
ncbi:hypothetical protein BD410DRAFT_824373 [Rickenella mellea]|uniref:Nucleolar 27S pre-rRNA processing Urb2/Npa2 C-terminal domain-containing protein n=1 Tax=Rickenella mellea TaxID=50990 RepID=A0A4Y7QM71_9AGAM|nr:hypothetical protein BD410DRAFT_824373 [Rickenella mellea]